MEFVKSIWDVLLLFFWAFVVISALVAMIMVASDLIRDRKLNGWWKALWFLFLVFVPLLTTLVYMIARGSGMAERSTKEAVQAREQAEQYIRDVAGTSAADEIAKAKALLDSGTITADEFAALKTRALAAESAPAAA